MFGKQSTKREKILKYLTLNCHITIMLSGGEVLKFYIEYLNLNLIKNVKFVTNIEVD